MHRLNRRSGRIDVVKRHKAKTLGQIRLLVNKHFGGDHTAKRQESRGEVCVSELLRQMVNEQVTAFGSYEQILCEFLAFHDYIIKLTFNLFASGCGYCLRDI